MVVTGVDAVESVMEIVNEISGIGECKSVVKKDCANLTRRVKLLAPMFEEVKEIKGTLPQETMVAFTSLFTALQSAKQLLKFGQEGSKLYLVLEREQVASKFRDVTIQLEQALNGLSYEQLDISDEVREQISEWMDSQRGLKLSLSDYAIRLDLIAKVHGIASAEKFFADLPQVAKIQPTYGALLNAYVNERLTEKVEAHMKRMEDLGFTMTALPYNELLTLYKNVGMFEKVPLVIQEMKKNNVLPDKFTYNIQMSTCAAMSDIDGTEKVFEEMEHNPIVNTDWTTYANLANIYIKAGHPDKAQSALKRMEIKMKRRDRIAYNYLITLYTSVGDKDGVSRAWESLKLAFPKLTNLSFICMLCSFVKLGDLEGAEKCFQEWECAGLSYDFRVPNILLDAYMKKGLFEKAELFLEHALEKGVTPIPKTWEIFVEGYLEKWQIDKAIEAMKKAIASVEQGEWRPKSTNVLVILKYFEEQGDVENGVSKYSEL